MIRCLIYLIHNRNKKKYGGIISALELEEFWASLLPEERDFIRECYASSLGVGDLKHLDNPKININTTQTASNFLTGYASWAISKKRFDLAYKLLNEALKRKSNIIDLHFTYNHLIDLCYRRRNEGREWLEKCINYCLADIDMFPLFKKEYIQSEKAVYLELANSPYTDKKERKEYLRQVNNVTFNLRIPSFERLAIIYEKQGKYEEAIKTCRLALDYGLYDSTKGGFDGRIERLEKKLDNAKKRNDGKMQQE